MQITLNVEGSQLDGEVKNLLGALTEDQKRNIAVEMLSKSLDQSGSELMLSTARKRVAEDYNRDAKDENEHVIFRNGRWYVAGWDNQYTREPEWSKRDALDKMVSERTHAHTFFKKEVLDQMVKTAQAEVQDLIKTSPVIVEALNHAKKTIEESLPKMVNDAMLMYFCTQMETMSRSVASAMLQGGKNQELLQEIQNKIYSGN